MPDPMRPDDVPAQVLDPAMRAWAENSMSRPGSWSAEGQVRAVLAAAWPEIERLVKEREAAALEARAHALPTGPASAFRRGMLAAARHVAPTPTPQEVAAAITRGDAVVCHLPEDTDPDRGDA